MAGGGKVLLQRVEDLRSHPHGVGQRLRADRHDHEFLEVDGIVGMFATIDDVHHRHRQHMGIRPTQIAVERHAGGIGCRLGHSQRDAENGVGAELALVVGPVEFDHSRVDGELFLRVHSADRVEDRTVDRFDGLANALAEIAVTAVAQFDRLIGARRGARRDGGTSEGAVLEDDVDLHGRIATAVQYFAGDDVDDLGHESPRRAMMEGTSVSLGEAPTPFNAR